MIEGLPSGLSAFLDKGLFLGTVALIVVAYVLGWWVSGREYRGAVKDRDFWRDIAMKGVSTAEKMADQKGAGVASLESIVKTVDPPTGGGDP